MPILLLALIVAFVAAATATPAQASICSSDNPPSWCGGLEDELPEQPAPPPPTVRMTTSGLGPLRDGTAVMGGSSRTVDVNFSEPFTIRAQAGGSATEARLTAVLHKECRPYVGAREERFTLTTDLGTIWTPSASERVMSIIESTHPCDKRGKLKRAYLIVRGEARSETGTVVGTGAVTYRYEDIVQRDLQVPESSHEVAAGVMVLTGDLVTVESAGYIWSGLWLWPINGPQGYLARDCPDGVETCVNPADYPAPRGAAKYSLIARLGGPWFPAHGTNFRLTFTHKGPPAPLIFRTNDNEPGNGNGAFTAAVTVERELAQSDRW